MAASVRIEDEAFSDARIAALGELAGYNAFEALGRMAHLWRLCTQRGIYVVSETLVRSCLGRAGVEAIVGAELGECVPGGVRVKGTEGRIEWLEEVRSTAVAGGRARAATAARAGGRFTSATSGTPAGHQPAGETLDQRHQPDTSGTPAVTSAPAPAPAPAPVQIDRSTLTIREIEQLGYTKCGQLGGSAEAAIRRLMPIVREELEGALRVNGNSWKYIAKVIESMRLEASKPKPPAYATKPDTPPGRGWNEYKPEEDSP